MKKCLNEKCGKEFEPASGKQKFCSPACKMAYKRAQDKIEPKGKLLHAEELPIVKSTLQLPASLGNLSDKVTTADKLDNHIRKEEIADFENKELGERLQSFCKQYKTNPDDLFSWLMDNYGKKSIKAVEAKETSKDVIVQEVKANVVGKPYDPMKNQFFRNKMIKKEP